MLGGLLDIGLLFLLGGEIPVQSQEQRPWVTVF